MNYKAFISDIDDTITLPIIGALPSEKVTHTIRSAIKKGIAFCLATGRPYPHIADIIKHLQLTSPVIVDNGAEIWSTENNTLLWGAYVPMEDAKIIMNIAMEFTSHVRLSCDLGVIEEAYAIPKKAKVVKKININGLSEKKSEECIAVIEDNLKDLAITKAGSWDAPHLIDVYCANYQATKQHAVLKLAEILHVSTHEMIGIGDHYNDFPLLMSCGLKVAMGNAVPELKAIADYIAPSVSEDGAADAIEKFVLTF